MQDGFFKRIIDYIVSTYTEVPQKMRKTWVLYAILLLSSGLFIAFLGKIIYIQTVEYEEWEKVANRRKDKDIEIPAQRGDILSSDGQILATSMPYYKLVARYGYHCCRTGSGEEEGRRRTGCHRGQEDA